MRISPFHRKIAKLVAQGLPPREIQKHVQISSSRISILKSNRLFQREVEHYARLEEDKYRKAINVMSDSAEDIAKKLVEFAVKGNLGLAPRDQAAIADRILDRLADTSTSGKNNGGNGDGEVTFEKILRVTKRMAGRGSEDADEEFDFDPESELEALRALDDDETEDSNTTTESPYVSSRRSCGAVIDITPSRAESKFPTIEKMLESEEARAQDSE